MAAKALKLKKGRQGGRHLRRTLHNNPVWKEFFLLHKGSHCHWDPTAETMKLAPRYSYSERLPLTAPYRGGQAEQWAACVDQPAVVSSSAAPVPPGRALWRRLEDASPLGLWDHGMDHLRRPPADDPSAKRQRGGSPPPPPGPPPPTS